MIVNIGKFTNNDPSIFKKNVIVINTKTLFVNDIQDISGDAIDFIAAIVIINENLIDNSDAKLK